jgi:hypothetical protein
MQNKEENLIIWQKWFDPFGDDEEQHNFDEEEIDSIEDLTQFQQKPMKAIATPMGIIPYTENTASSKIFNFWVGHTNFNITQNISDLIEDTDGVETLDVFTRYRFRIAIGKSFDESKVKTDINHRVYKSLSNGYKDSI